MNRQLPAARSESAFRSTNILYFQGRYGLSQDDISLDRNSFFTDPDGTGPLPATCDPILAGRFLCDAIGSRLTSSVGYTLLYDDRDNRIRPTRGQSFGISQDFAGLGGSVKYIKTRLNADKYFRLIRRLRMFGLSLEGGYIHPLENRGLGSRWYRRRPFDRSILPR